MFGSLCFVKLVGKNWAFYIPFMCLLENEGFMLYFVSHSMIQVLLRILAATELLVPLILSCRTPCLNFYFLKRSGWAESILHIKIKKEIGLHRIVSKSNDPQIDNGSRYAVQII